MRNQRVAACLGFAFMFFPGTALAQDQSPPPSTTDIDAIVQRSLDPASAMALARDQEAAGDLVAAAATLERLWLVDPSSDSRLTHAMLLCRLDDAEGAKVELGAMPDRASLDRRWSEVAAACGTIERPMAPEGMK